MKKLLATLSVAAIAGLAGIAPAAAQPLKVGISAEPYPPFTVPDAAGNWTGWEVDFAKAVCEEAKLDCVITPLSWDGIIPALNAGKIDMIITSMSITNDRLKTIDFTDSYYKSKSAVIGLKDLDFEATPRGFPTRSWARRSARATCSMHKSTSFPLVRRCANTRRRTRPTTISSRVGSTRSRLMISR
ncbi:transporter substrate-binding domain-containing protein [Paracoccus cavernae]|uniref:transporter substrate-binding domain-containing protein n=1 Tax=Paracoccus cavernae TaxID=1571207 RepID=UPI003639C2E2